MTDVNRKGAQATFIKKLRRVKCWNCPIAYSNAEKECPNCKEDNEDHKDFKSRDW